MKRLSLRLCGGKRSRQFGHLDIESGGAVIFHTRQSLDEFVERTTYDRAAWESPQHEHVIAVRTVIEWPDGSTLTTAWRPTVDAAPAQSP